jgi:glycosyltransferase involved in cell wall biosynthesis
LSKKPFVVYWNNIPSPYMVERFNLIADRNKCNFEAWFNDRIEHDRSWTVDESTWHFHHSYIKTFKIGGKRFHFPLQLLKHKKPDLLVSLYAEPSFIFGWVISKLRSIKTGFWVEKTFDSWVPRKKWKDTIKYWLFKRVDFIITVGYDGRKFAQRYGARRNRIFFAPHGIDVTHFSKGCSWYRSNCPQSFDKMRKNVITFIYVGRLLKKKGIHYLLEAFQLVQGMSNEKVELVLVGDGKDEKLFKIKCKEDRIRNVIFAGFHQKRDLPKFYANADVFVFPTLGDPYGLVIDEAMACSLPIISTEAVGEIDKRVKHRVNGYIVNPKDVGSLSLAMLKLANNSRLRQSMGSFSSIMVSNNTQENWAIAFERIFFNVLKIRDFL